MILLDTQTLLWFLRGDSKLGQRTLQILQRESEIGFSSLSILEFEAKLFDRAVRDQRKLYGAALEAGFIELRPHGAELERASDFPQLRKHDPLDRALIMQAAWNNADLYTSDQKLLSLGLAWVKDSQE
jgi:PIN domain nuclease of toxin-antitoxin system